MAEKKGITRSSGLPTGYGTWVAGGGYSGATEELDAVVQKEAELLRNTFGRDVEIRFNSDRHSGGAWLKDDLKGFSGNSQVGLTAAILPKVPKGLTRSEWYRKIADKVGWGKEHSAEVDKAPKAVVVETFIKGTVAKDPNILNSGTSDSRYASHEHGSLKAGLNFLVKNVDKAKINPYKGKNSPVGKRLTLKRAKRKKRVSTSHSLSGLR